MEPQLVEGGTWLAPGGNVEQACYITNPDHVARLRAEGFQVVADPRLPHDEPEAPSEPEPPPEPPPTEEENV